MVRVRQQGAVDALQRILGDDAAPSSAAMAEAAVIGRALVDALDFAGRPLAAAHADLAWPDGVGADGLGAGGPTAILWHACTVLREHRGDAHWAATSGEGLDAVECHVLHAADGAMPADLLRRVSGWTDAAWDAGVERLRRRGLVAGDPLTITDQGRATKLRVEWATDHAAAGPIAAVGIDSVERLHTLMSPWAATIMESGVIGAWKVREARWRDLPDTPRGE